MQNLLDSLINGTVEYKETGEMVLKAPTSVTLRAAREITRLYETIRGLESSNQVLAAHTNEQLVTISKQSETISKLTKELENANGDIRGTAPASESLQQSEPEASNVGVTHPEPTGSN